MYEYDDWEAGFILCIAGALFVAEIIVAVLLLWSVYMGHSIFFLFFLLAIILLLHQTIDILFIFLDSGPEPPNDGEMLIPSAEKSALFLIPAGVAGCV